MENKIEFFQFTGEFLGIKQTEKGVWEVSYIKREAEDEFILVDVESLSLDDEFMRYEPYKKDRKIDELKGFISKAIKANVKNFYRPKNDPSFGVGSNEISFAPEKKPAIGKSIMWWCCAANDYAPERGSRIGTQLEYAAFLGVLIKKLVEEGMSVADAWDAVCRDSRKLGHYSDSENAKNELELTGSREVCGFCDLGNTYKLLDDDESDVFVWFAGGQYYNHGSQFPLASLCDCEWRVDLKYEDNDENYVGWVVLER